MNDKYFNDGCRMCKNGREGVDQLTNFTAQIGRELVYHDGPKSTTHLIMQGRLHDEELDKEGQPKWPDGKPLPEVVIAAGDFAQLNWVSEKWGMQPIIYPVPGAERDLRTAIQLGSKPEREHIYTHTGWTTVGNEPHYLSASGGINRKGLDTSMKVQLPHELSRYELPKPAKDREAFLNSLRVVNIGPPTTLWPLLLATYRASMGSVDFSCHIAGRTGTFKSELCSLLQSHYGKEMDRQHLPASWSSTGNAIEALAYKAKNALMVVDDFVPIGTAYHVRTLQKQADQIFRGQGNQAGRSRLTDISAMQTTYYPRGMILSSGEDVPEGHSMRGRILIGELSPGDIDKQKLSTAQGNRESYSQAMADWVCWLAGTNAAERAKTLARSIRDAHLEVGHSRTPSTIGELLATLMMMGEYAAEMEWLTAEQWNVIEKKARAAVLQSAGNQQSYLEAADPVETTMETIRMMLTSGLAHAKTRNGGIPEDAELYGWRKEQSPGSLPNYKMQGPRLGWVDTEAGEFFLDANNITLLKKNSGGRLAITPQTLQKRLKEAGVLCRCDDVRQRNTIRCTLEGHQRQVLCIPIAAVFDQVEDE